MKKSKRTSAKCKDTIRQLARKLAKLLRDKYWVQCPLDVAKATDDLLKALK